MTRQTAQTLRARAHELRRLAIEIERSPVLGLDQYAGDETWRGDRPHLCVALLRTQLARLRDSVDDLRWRASRFEQQAVDVLAGYITGGKPIHELTA